MQMQLNSSTSSSQQSISGRTANDQQNHQSLSVPASTLNTIGASYSGAVVSGITSVSNGNPCLKPPSSLTIRPPSSSSSTLAIPSVSTLSNVQQDQSSSVQAGVSTAGFQQPATLVGHGQHSANTNEWQQQKAKKTKNRKVVEGRSVSSAVKGVVRKAIFCVNRLSPDTTSDDVCAFLSSCGIKVI